MPEIAVKVRIGADGPVIEHLDNTNPDNVRHSLTCNYSTPVDPLHHQFVDLIS